MEPLLTSANLNDLLSKAKASQVKWDEWESAGEYDRDDVWRQLHRDKGNAWNALYRSIVSANAQGPLRFTLKSGTIEVGAIRGVVAEMIHYSLGVKDNGAFNQVCLRDIERIEIV